MQIHAYAKINLGLRVIRKRSDGYHDLETIFHSIDWHDEVAIQTGGQSVTLSSDDPRIPTDESNLCLKAALQLRSYTHTSHGAQLHLAKHIPAGSGLGGGSSDAAAVLRGLTALWNLNLGYSDLMKIAASIGADVPFFVTGGSAIATERGDRITPLTLEVPYWILVVVPPVHISTAWAYQQIRTDPNKTPSLLPFATADSLHIDTLIPHLVNDFEPVVFKEHPVIAAVKHTLIEGDAIAAQMSGSGSAVFGLFADEESVARAARRFGPEYKVSITSPHFNPATKRKDSGK